MWSVDCLPWNDGEGWDLGENADSWALPLSGTGWSLGFHHPGNACACGISMGYLISNAYQPLLETFLSQRVRLRVSQVGGSRLGVRVANQSWDFCWRLLILREGLFPSLPQQLRAERCCRGSPSTLMAGSQTSALQVRKRRLVLALPGRPRCSSEEAAVRTHTTRTPNSVPGSAEG